MSECVCNGCKNLKGIMDDTGAAEEYECEYGFPSDKCSDCDGEECDLTCTHFIVDEYEDISVSVKCSACGRELSQVSNDKADGKIYCINCYFEN